LHGNQRKRQAQRNSGGSPQNGLKNVHHGRDCFRAPYADIGFGIVGSSGTKKPGE
jgi:hypothetical protein